MTLKGSNITIGGTADRIAAPTNNGHVFVDTEKDQANPYIGAYKVEFSRGKADTATSSHTGDVGGALLLGTGYTFPAASLGIGRSIRVIGWGYIDTDAGAAPSMTFSVVAVGTGTVVLCTTGGFLLPLGLNAEQFQLDASITVISLGTGGAGTGEVEAQGGLIYHTSPTVHVRREMLNGALVNFNTTIAETIKLQCSITGLAADAITLRSLQVHWLGGT